MTEYHANAIAKRYGYSARKEALGFFIARRFRIEAVALIKNSGEIVPYGEDYNAQDHLAASALAGLLLA